MRAAQIVTGLLFVLMGAWLGYAVREEVVYATSLSFQRYLAMADLLQLAEARGEALAENLAQLRNEAPMEVRRQTMAALVRQLAAARAAAGLTPETGPGLRLVLSDAPVPAVPGVNENAYLIHDIDLLELVNTLDAAGARAVSINGQRVVATTAIHCVGPVIAVNGVRTAPPVVVLAEGPPSALRRAVDNPDSIVGVLRLYGLPVQVDTGTVTVPAYHPPTEAP
jgi:uncharacterized protein YlxW (UPF0749 family)